MVTRLDQQGDANGQTLHKLIKLYDAPDFVKSASSDSINYTSEERNPNVFADVTALSFPCHTAPATYVSMLYCLENQGQLGKKASHIQGRIVKAAEYFGIKKHIDSLLEKHAQIHSVSLDALPDDSFAFVVEYENGVKERHLPLRNSSETKQACEYLRKYRGEFGYYDRVKIAERILKKGDISEISSEDQDYLYKQAGAAVGTAKKAARMLLDRAMCLKTLGKDIDLQAGLAKAAQACLQDKNSVHSISGMRKIASIIDRVDRDYKLSKFETLGNAEDLFVFTIKQASEFAEDHVQLTSGSVYKKADLEKISADAIKDLLGDSFLDRVSAGGLILDAEKFAEELRTLPRRDAQLFDKLAESARLSPVVKQAESIRELAAMYKAK